jgi:GNAT superfamily N-acetyltransferase
MAAQALDIRFAGEAESAVVSSILVEAATWIAARGAPVWPLEQLSAEAIAADVVAGRFVLARVGSEAIATARLTGEDPECWPDAVVGVAMYVHRIAVRRAWAGRGVVAMVLAWCEKHAAALGCRQVRLDCDSARPKLRRLYEGLGFRFHSQQRVGAYTVARYEREVRIGA